MSNPFIAEISIFAGNFAPRGWAFCNGQLLAIAQNTALFSLLGTTFGGDGRTTFGLPDLKGRAPMHPGRGPGLTARRLGEKSGHSTVSLQTAQMPKHTHALKATANPGNLGIPAADRSLARTQPGFAWQTADPNVNMAAETLPASGAGQAHEDMQPFLPLNFIIALVGTYPSRG